MNPQELRAKLLAQKQAQKNEILYRERIHEEAKDATKVMVMLGYNFDDIFDLATPKVSESYLTEMLRAVGYFRKRRRTHTRNSAFGAPRWLEYPDDMIIDFDHDSEESADEMYDHSKKENSYATAEFTDKENTIDREEAEKAAVDPQYLQAQIDRDSSVEKTDSTTTQDEATQPSPVAEPLNVIHNHSSTNGEFDGGVQMNDDAMNDSSVDPNKLNLNELNVYDAPEIVQPSNNMVADSGADTEIYSSSSREPANVGPDDMMTDSLVSHEPSEPADDADMSHTGIDDPNVMHHENETFENVDVDNMDENGENCDNEDSIAIEHTASVEEETHSAPYDQGSINSVDDKIYTKDKESQLNEQKDAMLVQQEQQHTSIDDVRAQILEIQNRQQKLVQFRRDVKLRDIATRRAKLLQAKQALNMTSITKRVARLESQLVEAKALMIQGAQRLREIDNDSKQLDKEELEINRKFALDETANGLTSSATTENKEHASAGQSSLPEQPSAADMESNVLANVEKIKYIPPTVESSPLRMFSSFRMCPALKPKYWFAPTFNSRFVPDLENRVFCSTELKRGSCRKKDCTDVHFAEFEIPGSVICQYMASRELDEPGFREGLIEAVETHLQSPEVPVENLAATIIGYRRKRDSTQFLDWGNTPRPF